MSTFDYLVRRLIQIIPVLFIVTIVIFFVIRLIPGTPVDVLLGDRATPELTAMLEKKLGIDKPIYVQYWLFMKNLFKGDLGNSLVYNTPVMGLLIERMKVTLMLTIVSTIFAVAMSLPLGFRAGKHQDGPIDQGTRAIALFALSMPQFWFGLTLMIIFSVKYKIFPVGGWGSTLPEQLRALILPGFTQALATTALLTKNLRNNVIDIIRSDYVDFAMSKGVSPRRIRNRHINKNALIPYVTIVAMRVSALLGGSIIIENVFALPGVGALMSQSIFSRDYAVVQGSVLIFALIVISVNILTDILYTFLDPRVRLG